MPFSRPGETTAISFSQQIWMWMVHVPIPRDCMASVTPATRSHPGRTHAPACCSAWRSETVQIIEVYISTIKVLWEMTWAGTKEFILVLPTFNLVRLIFKPNALSDFHLVRPTFRQKLFLFFKFPWESSSWCLPSCPAFSQTIIPPPPPPIMEGIDGVSMKHHKWWFHTCLCHCCGSRCKWCPCFCAIPWFQSLANWFERCHCLWLAVIHGWIICEEEEFGNCSRSNIWW